MGERNTRGLILQRQHYIFRQIARIILYLRVATYLSLKNLIFSISNTNSILVILSTRSSLLHKVVTIIKVLHHNNIINNHNQCIVQQQPQKAVVDVVQPFVVLVVLSYVVAVLKIVPKLFVKKNY